MLWDMLLRLGEKLSYSGIAGERWPKRKSYESRLKRIGVMSPKCINVSPLRGPEWF